MSRPIVEELVIRITSQSNQPRGKLIRFIKEYTPEPREVIINLLESCWLVLALKMYGGANPEKLKLLALQYAVQLEGYARVLREQFQLAHYGLPGMTPINLAENDESVTRKILSELEENSEDIQLNKSLELRRSMFG